MTPKYSFETELSVLGSIITLGDCKSSEVQKTMLLLTDDCFYKPQARAIYKILRDLYDKKRVMDVLAVIDYLKREDLVVNSYFEECIKDKYFSKFCLENATKLVDLSILRKQIEAIQQMLNFCTHEVDVEESQNLIKEGIIKIGNISRRKSLQGSSFNSILEKYLNNGYKSHDKIATNIRCLDDQLHGGIENQSLVTICGDSGMGKTFFSIYLMAMINQRITEKQSLFFSLEMTENKIFERLMGIHGHKQFSDLETIEFISAAQNARQHDYTIYEEDFKDISTIETIARTKALEKPLSIIVVDYLSLVDCKGQFERNDLRQSEIAKRLASLSMELDCIVIALTQANREPSKRNSDDRCPYPQDAADSSGSFRSSSLWFGIDRPELHDDSPCLQNKFVVKCRKNRFGSPFECVWAFDNGTFKEVDQHTYFKKPMKESFKPNYEYK